MLCLFHSLLSVIYSSSLHAQRLIWVEWRDPTHHPNLSERCPQKPEEIVAVHCYGDFIADEDYRWAFGHCHHIVYRGAWLWRVRDGDYSFRAVHVLRDGKERSRNVGVPFQFTGMPNERGVLGKGGLVRSFVIASRA